VASVNQDRVLIAGSSPALEESRFSSYSRVRVPPHGYPLTRHSPRLIARVVRQVVAATLAIRRLEAAGLRGEWYFYRAVGLGPDPLTDAWAALYDRAMLAGLSARRAFTLAARHDWQSPDEGEAREYLFPWTMNIEDSSVAEAMRAGRTDAAILLPNAPREDVEIENQEIALGTLLRNRGWQVSRIPRDGRPALQLIGDAAPLALELGHEPPTRGSWDLMKLLDLDLASIDTLTLQGKANASDILTTLFQRQQLAVNVRDICSSSCRGLRRNIESRSTLAPISSSLRPRLRRRIYERRKFRDRCM